MTQIKNQRSKITNGRRPVAPLCRLIDCRAEADKEAMLDLVRPAPWEFETRQAWRFVLRPVFEGGELGKLRVRSIWRANRQEAMAELAKLMAGFGAMACMIYLVVPPADPDELVECDRLNHILRQWLNEYGRDGPLAKLEFN